MTLVRLSAFKTVLKKALQSHLDVKLLQGVLNMQIVIQTFKVLFVVCEMDEMNGSNYFNLTQ